MWGWEHTSVHHCLQPPKLCACSRWWVGSLLAVGMVTYQCMCRIWRRGVRSAWIGMPRDGGCRLRLLPDDVGSGADKRQSAHQLWISCVRGWDALWTVQMGDRWTGWTELLLGMSILEGIKQRGSSLIQSSKHLEKSCTHPVQAQYHAQRIQRSGNHVDARMHRPIEST